MATTTETTPNSKFELKDFKMKVEQMGCGNLKDRVAAFNQRASDTQRKLEKNPFSGQYQGKREFDKNSEIYGRPEAGSLTERRGIKAGKEPK